MRQDGQATTMTIKPGTRVLIAARLSQLGGTAQTGIETQDEDTRRLFESHGCVIVGVARDTKTSSQVPPWNRRDLGPWMANPAMRARYDAIAASSQDRLSRGKWRDEIEIRKWAEDNGKELWITDTQLHWPADDMAEHIRWEIDAMRARDEWEKDSRRYRRAQRYLRDNGFLVGRPPFTHRVIGATCGQSPCSCPATAKDHKLLEPDLPDGNAKVALDMIERYLAGESLLSIARWLDAEGVPCSNSTSESWAPKIVGDILRSESLIGRRRDSSGKIILRFEPLIDVATFHKLQALLNANARRRGSTHKNPGMLTGAVYCGKCGRMMHYLRTPTTRKDGSQYVWLGYRCAGTPKVRSTCKVMVTASKLDDWVNREFAGRLAGLRMSKVEIAIVDHGHQDEIDEITEQMLELDPDAPDYLDQHAALFRERKRLKEQQSDSTSAQPETTYYQLGALGAYWAELSEAERRAYLLHKDAKVYVSGKDESAWRLDITRPEIISDLAYPLTAEGWATLTAPADASGTYGSQPAPAAP